MSAERTVLVVLYTDDLPDCLPLLEAAAEVRCVRAADLAAAMPGADALLLWDFFSSAVKDVWEHADSLKWIHVAAAGVDKLLFDGLRESGVIVTNSRGIFDRPIAEFVLASILALAKDLPGSLRRQQTGVWEHRDTERIDETRALIVGTGSIGRETARLLRAVGMRIEGVGRATRADDADFGVVHASTSLVDIVGEFDYVILIAPLTEATRGMIGASVLEVMKPTARLVNVGRGELVDEDALAEALRRGGIAGAALDVFNTEPLPATSPLWAMENVLISAHMSGDAAGWLERLSALYADNFGRYTRGAELLNVVDKKLGFVPGG